MDAEADELDWLDGSAFRGRRHGPGRPAEARNYCETRAVYASAFEAAWENTSGHAGSDAGGDEKQSRPFGCGTMQANELSRIKQALHKWFPLMLPVFTYYSCIGAEVNNIINGINHAGFALLIDDASLDILASNPSRFAKLRGEGWELVWAAINNSKESAAQSEWNDKSRFTRGEFLEFLVRAVVSDETPPMQMASLVDEFCEELVSRLASQPDGESILQNPDAFRKEHCYQRETNAMLGHHETTLRSVFAVYAEKGAGAAELDGSPDLMSAAQWMALMKDVGFVREVGVRQLFTIFAQSRMTTSREDYRRSGPGCVGQTQLVGLPYEGFLEVIVRLALLKALPTDKEMRKHQYQYPGEYLGALLARGVAIYENWVVASKRSQANGKGDKAFRRVDMLCLLIVSVMQYGVEQQPGGPSMLLRGHPDEELSFEEVKRYHKRPTRHVFEEGPAS